MDKYFVFRKMLEFMADYAEVVDADMNNYNGCVMVKGETEDQTIMIEVTIQKKEVEQDA